MNQRGLYLLSIVSTGFGLYLLVSSVYGAVTRPLDADSGVAADSGLWVAFVLIGFVALWTALSFARLDAQIKYLRESGASSDANQRTANSDTDHRR
jgi:hypothetical protein